MGQTDEENFDRRWLHESTEEFQLSTVASLNAVREFAYLSFDRLDKDGNGFLEVSELVEVLEKDELSNREKSFVMFLLHNREQIAQMHADGNQAPVDGITREDINLYFQLLATLL